MSRQTLEKWSLIPHFVHVLPFAGHVFQGREPCQFLHQKQVLGSQNVYG